MKILIHNLRDDDIPEAMIEIIIGLYDIIVYDELNVIKSDITFFDSLIREKTISADLIISVGKSIAISKCRYTNPSSMGIFNYEQILLLSIISISEL